MFTVDLHMWCFTANDYDKYRSQYLLELYFKLIDFRWNTIVNAD